MTRNPAIWMLCLGLVLTRLMGLHVHACAGIDAAVHQHEAAHFADSGLLFGESHAGDHADNLELDLTTTIPVAKLPFDVSDDPAFAIPELSLVSVTAGSMTVRTSRGPPAARDSRPAHFTPPLRGPPSHSLA